MSFQSLSCLAFLAVTVPLCCLAGCRHRRWGQWLLTLACLVFYAAGGRWQGLLALAAGLAVTAAALRGMEKAPARRRALVLGCANYSGQAGKLQAALGVPVLDGLIWALILAEGAAREVQFNARA